MLRPCTQDDDAFWKAVAGGDAAMAGLLVTARRLTLDSGEGWQPLHMAARHGHLEVVKVLVSGGALWHVQSRDGRTPLELARRHQRTAVLEWLEAQVSAPVRATTRTAALAVTAPAPAAASACQHCARCPRGQDDRLFVEAVKGGDVETVGRLVTSPGRVALTDWFGTQPLHEACAWGQLEVVKILVASGAKLSARNHDGRTPLDVARLHKQSAVVKWFRSTSARSSRQSSEREDQEEEEHTSTSKRCEVM